MSERFQSSRQPAGTSLVGMAKLVEVHALRVPVTMASVVSEGSVRGSKRRQGPWTVFDNRYAPDDTLEGHLTFALRHEPFDLLFLKRLFDAVGGDPIEAIVTAHPTGRTSRKLWYLYETFAGRSLDLPDANAGNYVSILDPAQYVTAAARMSQRHRVRDNLLGSPDFCPVVRRTTALKRFAEARLGAQAAAHVDDVPTAFVERAARLLAREDIKASWQIEGERLRPDRIDRLARVFKNAGARTLGIDELESLQLAIVDGDRFITPGLRRAGGFIGDRDHENKPVPEFVSAKAEDISSLVDGFLKADERMAADGVDPVVRAACLSFGFLFVHPFNDGNGRLHRHLTQHVLAATGFSPRELPLPVSLVIQERLSDYGRVLRSHTAPLLPFISWTPTEDGNVEVLNETADLYRFGDYTALAEFLYGCVETAITETLPDRLAYLKSYDRAKVTVGEAIQMPDNILSLLINLVWANGGRLPDADRQRQFAPLTAEEVAFIEEAVSEAFAHRFSPEGAVAVNAVRVGR
ncbi:Fic family protein [Rhizobium sp. BK176]|uniref:Fic family protein n=1 Tax=Rhizobium sp. BK176 TaxID=2587071 RepID=UPI00216812D9|nr:Fic family protein [Rhizobium sp. BK176]MCS4090021.1 hypothetical protein [Rhizobium sp. BK176]